jgi:hypothetical protein
MGLQALTRDRLQANELSPEGGQHGHDLRAGMHEPDGRADVDRRRHGIEGCEHAGGGAHDHTHVGFEELTIGTHAARSRRGVAAR